MTLAEIASNWNILKSQSYSREPGDLYLPKFRTEFDSDLVGYLKELGIKQVLIMDFFLVLIFSKIGDGSEC